jgi:NAD(P)-dependent dehydrogenase (short-subunit alcohol dehydrogenase family)
VQDFTGRLAVVTGGGTGMGRELVRQLAAEGCDVATCDVSAANLETTRALAEAAAPQGTRVSTHVADVADEAQVLAFRDAAAAAHGRGHVNLLFNNAGVGGGGSFVAGDRADWERTFAICWGGVYLCTRAFLPLLVRAPEAHIVNTSSVNGFWASLGPQAPHTAYSAAKFAVKGFSEALVNDLRLHAPHLRVSVVMPGYVGTSIVDNSYRILRQDGGPDAELAAARAEFARHGADTTGLTLERVRALRAQAALAFEANAPTTAAQAVKVILDGVRAGRWRILVGHDAEVLDRLVREAPEEAYEVAFFERLRRDAKWGLGR